jgi:hypothetical protein
MYSNDAFEAFLNMNPYLWVGEDAAVAGVVSNNHTGGDRIALNSRESMTTNLYNHKTWWFNYNRGKELFYKDLAEPEKFMTGEDYLRQLIEADPDFRPYGLPNITIRR